MVSTLKDVIMTWPQLVEMYERAKYKGFLIDIIEQDAMDTFYVVCGIAKLSYNLD